MAHHAIRLYEYNVWANRQVIEHLKELPAESYTKEIQSVFSSLSKVMAHTLVADHIWFGVLAGESFEQIMSTANRLREETKETSLDEMEHRFLEISNNYTKLLAEQDDLDRRLQIEHPSYGRLDATFAELVQHVVNHGTYHRGNITAMLHQLGYKGVPTDYVYYLYTLEKKVN